VDEGNSSNGKLALVSAAVAAGGLYDVATSTAAPGPTTELLRWILVACLLVGLVGWFVEFRSQN
jgi:hypothetical protein